MKKYSFIFLFSAILCNIAGAQSASEWTGAYVLDGEVYKTNLSIWNSNNAVAGLLDLIESKSYNNKITGYYKGDSLVIERYSRKTPTVVSSVLKGIVQGDRYSGSYTLTSDQMTGAFVFVRNNNALVKQQPVPDIKFASLDNQTLSLGDHKGKYLLVDFWGTYCKTCIPKRMELDSVFTKYGDRLEIISISLDKDPGSVKEFRQNQFAMPWKNASVSNNFEAAICKLFGVDKVGLPSIFLISPEGKLLAKTNQLLQNGIDNTVKEYLNTR
jgi:peroxiredoxin